jgi:2-polyprenyl-6-methoxyphenol hydroxylase-like FAD-dependent oxidoreductase
MPVFKVIIVGGGLSGTLLANGLLNNEVEFMLYERDASDSKREGYQIRLGEAAMIGFQSCLTGDQIASVQHKFGQSLGGSSTAPSLYTSSFKRILDLTSLPSYTKSSAINRVTLRNLLMESVQRAGKVAFNKAFSHYEIVPNIDGEVKVKVYFADGTHDTGDILIGADGSGSLVSLDTFVFPSEYVSM